MTVQNYQEDLRERYLARLRGETSSDSKSYQPVRTSNYQKFKSELMPRHMSRYEQWCQIAEKIFKIKPDEKRSAVIEELLALSHIRATPAGTLSFAVLASLILFLASSVVAFLLFQAYIIVLVMGIISLVVFAFLYKLPDYFANTWRLKASNQMVHCVFYMVTYMRHTSNIEHAVGFAADHLSPPLSIDLKKVLWDLETEKFSTIQESLDDYLHSWKNWNSEFIESIHMLEGSLLETSDDRRLAMVDKALDIMLQETYEKMLHYAHNLKNPLTTLYMLGIILPILGLVILPMVVSFLTKSVPPFTIAMIIALLYNILIPIGIYFLSKSVLSTRPTGYGETDISDDNPELRKYRKLLFHVGNSEFGISPKIFAWSFGILFFIVGVAPLVYGEFLKLTEAGRQILLTEPSLILLDGFKFLEYRTAESGDLIGPYGIGASVVSLFIPLALGVSLGVYYKLSSQNVMKIRESAKKLEEEFASALFQLGNRLADGLPTEVAFQKVSSVMKGTVSGEFFNMTSNNMTSMGMGLEQALFDKKHGSLVYYPSAVIESSMKVLIESSRKGPTIAAQSVMNISRYIKEIHRVNERLRDLLADIVGDMKQQSAFLAPVISAIVVGITSMIILILGRLTDQLKAVTQEGVAGSGVPPGLVTLFGDGVPTFYFQVIVGLYVVQIVFILSILVNGIENGSDKLAERFTLGRNLLKSTLLYVVIALIVIVMFNSLASSILGSGVLS